MAHFFRARPYSLPTTNYSLGKARWAVIFLLVVSAATHFAGLTQPREVVFDEVHFGKFVSAYCCTRERFFDIHPPHAKLLIAGAVRLSGYDGRLPFEHIGQPYGSHSPLPWRVVPALAGTLLPLVIYGVLRQLDASRPAAWFAGAVVVLDNALTVQTRIIALDGVLLLATFGSLWAYLAAEKSVAAGRTRRWLSLAALAGALAGLAVGVKFTGLSALGLIGLIGVYRVVTSVRQFGGQGSLRAAGRWLLMGLVIIAAAAVVYISGWIVHFVVLTQPGSGDAWGVPALDAPIVASFARELTALHKTMYNANNGLTIVHHDSSPWWGWPFMSTPVFYWQKSVPDSPLLAAIYFIGNPVVWVGSTLLLFVTLAWLVLEALRRGSVAGVRRPALLIPLVGYAISFWPLTRVDRGLFLYHYLTPLLFAVVAGIAWLDGQGWFNPGSLRRQPSRVYVSGALLLFFFILFSPLTFGFLVQPEVQNWLFWFKNWR